ncbi:MAG: SDR family NAD(P)-dependent oxidoreductase [Hyphomonadaceae bacterium]|nr:SDR family NAD(P)-dependent oxidoreductase [Hyphomonadaceae bacterium]
MQGKTIVITGAFGVLGRAVSARAKAQGWKVAQIDFVPAPADATGDIVLGGVDLGTLASAEKALNEVREKAGSVNALLNIAGGFAWRPFSEADATTWQQMFDINVKTAVNASKAALPHLIEANGAIVNVGSAAALLVQAGQGMGAYAASKAGVHKLTESLAEEYKGRVRVNAVLPSILDTPANRRDMPNVDPAIWVAPEDLANVMLFLASDAAKAMTGALVPVTGRV